MKTLLISAAVVFVVVAGVIAVSMGASSPVGSVFIPVTNVAPLEMPATPSPGVYQTTPYLGMAVVPRPVDGDALHVPKSTDGFVIRTVEPPLGLTPRK